MKMSIFIAVSSLFIARFYPQWCGLAAAGASARLVGWTHVIVDGRRGDDQSRVRQDKRRLPETLTRCLHIFFSEIDEFIGGSFPQVIDIIAPAGRLI